MLAYVGINVADAEGGKKSSTYEPIIQHQNYHCILLLYLEVIVW